MTWEPIAELTLTDNWQYTPPVTGNYFRVVATSPQPPVARMTIAQANIAGLNPELFDAVKLATPATHILRFNSPPFWGERRIGVRKSSRVPPWSIRIEQTLVDLPDPTPSDNPIIFLSTGGELLPGRVYWVDSLSLVSLSLPIAAADLQTLELVQSGLAPWTLSQAAGQSIRLGDRTTTTGITGRISSTAPGDRVVLVYRSSLDRWESTLIQGNLEIV